jgi:hypothetical protein
MNRANFSLAESNPQNGKARFPTAAAADSPPKEHNVAFIMQILSSFSKTFFSLATRAKKKENSNAPALYFA